MATLYSYTSVTNNTGTNWNGANDNYAWSFTATATGIPNQLVLRIHSIVGTPTGNFYIKANKTIASSTFGTASGVTITSGSNTINLTGGSMITSGVQYWIYFERTSAITNYPRLYNEYTSPPIEQFWRSSASNIDPNTRYDSGVKNIGISMDINGAAAIVKALVVAGGGGGGYSQGGGGGGGGVLYDSFYAITPGAKTVTVGNGGPSGSAGANGSSINGQNSVFDSLTAIGGGGGGGNPTNTGGNGGSGGGGSNDGVTPSNGGSGTSGQGYAGGNCLAALAGGGGGGGAGAVGGNSTVKTGGAGIANSISGSSVTYGGGGGGSLSGAGGAGGGGGGSTQGTDGLGGGGGAWNGTGTAGRGGNGVVIISYATDGSDGVSPSSTGGTITTSGGQTIHTFTSSGTFTMIASSVTNSNFFMFF